MYHIPFSPSDKKLLIDNGLKNYTGNMTTVLQIIEPCNLITWTLTAQNPKNPEEFYGIQTLRPGFPEIGRITLSSIYEIAHHAKSIALINEDFVPGKTLDEEYSFQRG